MRSKTVVFAFFLLIVWGLITYNLIYDKSTNDTVQKKQTSRLSKLEKEIEQLILSNQELIKNVKGNFSKQDKLRSNNLFVNRLTDKPILPQWEDADNDVLKRPRLKFPIDINKVQPFKPNEIKEVIEVLPKIGVLVITCNRVTVRRCLDQLLKYRPSAEKFPIIVSQDCRHAKTAEVLRSYGNKIVFIEHPDQSDIEVPPQENKFKGYFKIARHYKWALNQMFYKYNFEATIVIEDDLDVSPDFFEYFQGTYFLLVNDPSIWCVSAWNDNGKAHLVDENAPELLYRTDFFPGLGWMLTRDLWTEISGKWPKSYWDDWIRRPEQRKDRVCIRPELSRTRTFGKIGVSNGLFYEKHLKYIKLNEKYVPFSKMNLTYLMKDVYDEEFVENVYKTRVVDYLDLKFNNSNVAPGTVRILYYNRLTYKSITRAFGLMDDFKSGVPRTSYQGIVSFYNNNRRIYLAPNVRWVNYDPSWS